MRKEVIVANPAGNITALVPGNINSEHYKEMSENLMAIPGYNIEQVGFIQEPKLDNTVGRLEMMGGEFCANASRSFAMFLAFEEMEGESEFLIEVSGASTPVLAFTNTNESTAGIELIVEKKITELKIDDKIYPVVHLDGIVHVLALDMEEDENLTSRILQEIKTQFNPEATGVMYLNTHALTMVPLVYVAQTDTLIREGSCGSGTIAASIYFCDEKEADYAEFNIVQPGGSINAYIKSLDNDMYRIKIGGYIELQSHFLDF